MILAAGMGTRLGTLGTQCPKPLVPVCGYPAITFSLVRCAAAGLRDVVINLFHHGEQIRRALGDGASFGVRIRYSEEEVLLGTGGGIEHARRLFAPGPVLVINGKVVADLAFDAVVAAHQASGALATLVVRPNPDPELFPPIAVDARNRVVGIRGRRIDDATPPVTDRMFAGIYVMEPRLVDRLPRGVSDVLSASVEPALVEGLPIGALFYDGYFEEHSTPERYLEGNLRLLRDPSLLAHPPGPLLGVDPSATVHPTATLVPPVRVAAGATVEAGAIVGPEAVVGEGARIGAGAHLKKSVVWPGVEHAGAQENAIVTPQGTVTCVLPEPPAV